MQTKVSTIDLIQNKPIQLKLLTMHDVMGTTAPVNGFRRASVSLGNTKIVADSQIEAMNTSYLVNSFRNSHDTPDWMSSTQSHYRRRPYQATSVQAHYPFIARKSGYKQEKIEDPQSQFEFVPRKKQRSRWDMINHTFQFDWPKPQPKPNSNSEKNNFFKVNQSASGDSNNPEPGHTNHDGRRSYSFGRPQKQPFTCRQSAAERGWKYSIRQSPLHVQRETPLKIGHPTTVNSIRIK